METPEPSLFGAVTLALEQQPDRDRRQCARKAVGREHRERDREAEWREQVFCRPFKKNDRSEHAADRQRRDQGRHRYAGGAVQGRFGQWLVFLGQQTMGVLDRHGRVVDENADGEHQSAQCHRVERIAEEIENDQRRQDGERDRDHHHQGRAPGPEE
jgi:hypothetical protein